MGNPVQLTVDENEKELLERAAARQGITVQDYLKRVASGTLRPMPAWQAPQPHLPLPTASGHAPRTFQETVDSIMERMMMMNMMRTMPGLFQDVTGGSKPLTFEDLDRAIDSRLKKDGGDDDGSMMKMYREAFRMKTVAKAMAGLEGDAPPAIQKELQETRERFEKAQAELMGKLQAKDEQIRQKEEADKEARQTAQFDLMRQESLAAIQKVEAQVLQIRQTGNQPPKGEIDTLVEGISRLDTVRSKLEGVFGKNDPKSQRPWWMDEIKEMINVAGDNAGKVLEGVGAVEAGRRGLPPPGQTSRTPEGAAPVYSPAYVDTNAAPPRPSAGADPYPMLAGYQTDPADLSTWPEIPYSEQDNVGVVQPMPKAEFVRKYGTHIHAQRKAAGVLPAPMAPAPELADTWSALSGGATPDVPAAPVAPATTEASPAPAPSLLTALGGGGPTEVPPSSVEAPKPELPTAVPDPAVTEPPKDVQIPEGAFGRPSVGIPVTVDLEGTVQG